MRRNNKKNLFFSILLLLILSIGIGYAYLTSNLTINGATKVSSNSWDIHFANLVVNENSVTATTPATIDPTDNTTINYSVKLDRPGDIYAFTVDIVNTGSIPGEIALVNISGIDESLNNIVDSKVSFSYDHTTDINGSVINPNESKNIYVEVYYKQNITADDLPTSNINLDLSLNITFAQSKDMEINGGNLLANLAKDTACVIKYEGEVTDSVGNTVTANNVYFDKCADKRNIIFNNICWQVLRSTEDGGTKLVYNGKPMDEKCESTREDQPGIVQSENGGIQTFNGEYLYGTRFTYKPAQNRFIISDEFSSTWSDETYENLLGKFTCKNTSNRCSTLYQVNSYGSNTEAYVSTYTIGNLKYASIGKSSYNANHYSPAMVGYMFNKVYNYKYKSPGTDTYLYGNSFTYDANSNTYTLSGTTKTISDWNTGYSEIANTHYTCWNTTGTCNTISYITFSLASTSYYFDLTDGKNINDLLNEMINNDNVNKYNSSVKGMIDNWFNATTLDKYLDFLKDTVYCNDRSISQYGSFEGNTSTNGATSYLRFNNYPTNASLACANITDQFSMSNNKAKLKYPVGLATSAELYNYNLASEPNRLRNIGIIYWSMSPYSYSLNYAMLRNIDSSGELAYTQAYYNSDHIRPVITLSSTAIIGEGSGTEADPWLVTNEPKGTQ